MPFAYYKNLSPNQRRVYDRSNEILKIDLPESEKFKPYLQALDQALKNENRAKIQDLCQKMMRGFSILLKVPNVQIKILAKRPSDQRGELHGLYEREIESGRATITLWIRTAQRKDVVKFKTFLRTFLHEVCHHCDYTIFQLADSFHTEAFYKRESLLYKTLMAHL